MSTSLACLMVFLATALEGVSEFEFEPQDLQPKKETSNVTSVVCPTWFTPEVENDNIWCVCNQNTVHGGTVIRCPKKSRICLTCEGQEVLNRDDLNISILSAFCMTHNFITQQTLLATCPYNNHLFNSSDFFVTLPSNLSDLNGFMCDNLARQGDLCNSCDNNTGPNILGRSGKCLRVDHSILNWFFFLSLEFVPPTVIFFLILCCKFRATTGPLNAFIFFCQMFYTLLSLQSNAASYSFGFDAWQNWKSAAEGIRNVAILAVGTFYTFWDNQYAGQDNFSVLTNISTIQVTALQYLSALYPLFLVVLTYVVVRLHYNGCRLLVYMWRPFQYCKSRLGINWEPITSIIHTFATFILLVYTKIIEVSFSLLVPSSVYNETGKLPYKIVYYDASIHFLSHQHLPYIIFALSMLTIFCGLPVLVLFLYPMACFQRLLSKMTSPHIRQMLRIFTEAYTGCYKDRTMPHQSLDCRYFASLYFLFRVVYLTCLFFLGPSYVWLAHIFALLFMSSLFAILQPYKSKWLNIIDTVAFSLAAVVTLLYAYDIYIAKIPLWVLNFFFVIPLLYFVSLTSHKIFTKVRDCWKSHRAACQEAPNEDQRLFQREQEGASESSPLLNPT